MYGHKLAAKQIRVLVQVRPLPGSAVHRPCVGRCHPCGCLYSLLSSFVIVLLPGSCCSASSYLSSCDVLNDGLLQLVVSDGVAEIPYVSPPRLFQTH